MLSFMHRFMHRMPRVAMAILFVFALTIRLTAGEPGMASRLRVLIVADTESKSGSTWKRDGENMKELLEAALQKQNLLQRATITMLTGKDVTPEVVLEHYATLKTDATETLLFYFSGHGSIHAKRGHFLAFLRGNLYRDELIAAMKKHNPQMIVLLTDTCAGYQSGCYATNAHPPVHAEGPIKPSALR